MTPTSEVPLGDPLSTLLARLEPDPPRGSAAGAAVMAVLRPGRTDLEILLIERAIRSGDLASGQVGLPGGRSDHADGSLTATALRELEEEVGLSASDLVDRPRFAGLAQASVFGLTVAVFAAELGPAGRAPTARDHHEVAHVFWLPRASLHHYQRVDRDTSVGRRTVEAVVHDGHVLWGFTRRVLLDLFRISPEEVT